MVQKTSRGRKIIEQLVSDALQRYGKVEVSFINSRRSVNQEKPKKLISQIRDMKTIESKGPYQVVTIGLEPEEKLLESIQDAIKKHDIRNGAVVSGVGTLKRCHLHYVDTSTFPPVNKFYVIDEPLEIGSISGLIADYEPHLHITVGCREDKAWNGHLENDSVVLYLAEVCILKMNHHGMKRKLNPKYNLALLNSG